MRTKIIGTCAALLLGATLSYAQGPDASRTTIMTFSAPVSLPGVTLPAGSYLFKLADSQVNRNIVQVFDKDRTKIFATIMAIPAQRNEPADETVVTFRESPANAAPAVQYWYYPGERTGQEFAYPKRQAMEIANAAHTSVLAIDADASNPDSMKSGAISRVEPGENAAQASASPSSTAQSSSAAAPATTTPSSSAAETATTPNSAAQATTPSTTQPSEAAAAPSTPQSTQPEQATAQQPSSTTPSSTASSASQSATPDASATPRQDRSQAVGTSGTRKNLPKTASTLPLVGFAGVLALLSAFGVRAFRRAQA